MAQSVILLAFANDPAPEKYLQFLKEEMEIVKKILLKHPYLDVRIIPFATVDKIMDHFQSFHDRVVIFHYAGHAGSKELLLLGPDAQTQAANASALADFLGLQKNLQLVFLNGCATKDQVKKLQEVGIDHVIATIRNIKDKKAQIFAERFYKDLSVNYDFFRAFESAKANIQANDENIQIEAERGFLVRKKEIELSEFSWKLFQSETASNALEFEKEVGPTYPKALTKIPGPPENFIGRENDVEAVEKVIQGERPVLLLNGLGGIGKTTLARYFVHKHWDAYNHIAWISVLQDPDKKDTSSSTSIQAFSNELDLFQSLGLTLNPEQAEKERAIMVLRALRQLPGNKLLVIDNAGKKLLDLYSELPQAPSWHLLVSSRQHLDPFELCRLDELTPTEAEKLFYKLYPKGKETSEKVKELLAHIGYHTLTIELFARACQNNPLSLDPATILEKLKTKTLTSLNANVWAGRSEREVKVYSYLLEVFELSNLKEEEKALLTQWGGLPSEDISISLVKQLFSIDDENLESFQATLMELVEKGWLGFSNRSFRIHQMIQEIIRYQLPPTEENCQELIKGTIDLISYDQNKDNPVDNFPYASFGDILLSHLPKEGKQISLLQNELAILYDNLGQYEKARDLYELALASGLKNLGEDHPMVAIRRNNLAGVYDILGQYEKAIELYELALASGLKNLGEDHPMVAIRRNNLALVYDNLGQYEKAIELYELALTSGLKNFGEAHPEVATIRNNLARVHYSLGQYEKARDLYELALASGLKNFGEDHPSVATYRSNLAAVSDKLGQYEKVKELYELALTSDLKSFGTDHRHVAIRRNNLAGVYKNLGQYEKAIELYELALASDLKSLGEDHPSVANDRNNLAEVYDKSGQYEKAIELYELAYQAWLKVLGESHPNTQSAKRNLDALNERKNK